MPQAAAQRTVATGARVAPDTIQCFKPGTHLALSGAVLAFGEADLEATAQAYDPALHEAPLVVGHPTTDGPAYGWVGALQHLGGALEALPRQVNAEFAAQVNAGAYKKVSCAFWAPDAPGNPVPGVYYLRHVGFLGATAPAVKGLRTPQFAAGEAGVVEFSEWDDVTNAGLWRSLRDWVLGKFGQEEADKAVPAYLVSSVEQGAQQELADARAAANADITAAPAFAAPLTRTPQPQETTTVDAKTAQTLTEENARLKQQLADQAAASRTKRLEMAHADSVAFADGLVAGARLAVGERDLVVATLDALAAHAEDTGAVLMFGEGEAKAAVLPAMRQLLSQLPARADLGRVATQSAAAGTVEASLVGSGAQRRAAIATMFPDLPAGH